MIKKLATCHLFLVFLISSLTGCNPSTTKTGAHPGDKIIVVATTTIVGDVIRNVGGDSISLSVLLPLGMDPHSFQPNPQDVARIAGAHMVVMNGAGLETFMIPLLENAGGKAILVDASQGISLLQAPASEEHQGDDPHVWMDPNNVMIWVKNIQAALINADPRNEPMYRANAEAYLKLLRELDAWIQEQVKQVPPENRRLVTDHQDMGYFAKRYGFEQVGAIVPSFSTAAEPSARDLASLEDAIRALGVKAIFIGKSFNPSLAQRVAADTHTQIVYVLSGSLTEAGGEADNYLDYIRYDVKAITDALK